MTKIDYASSGVNIQKGDTASRAAYQNAKKTFIARKGKIGEPFSLEGGFSGALDFGDFLIVQNDDGVGTKSEISERLNKFDTIGEDLLCTVADDAICMGAEVISVTNTADVPIVNPEILDQMTASLARACLEQKVVIPGGEIAELGSAVNKIVWNATAVGIVKKDKFITGKNVKSGQKIVGLKGRVLRSNGISLARKICEVNFGENWHKAEWKDGVSWGEILLTPCKIFHRLLLDNVLGDFEGERKFSVDGIVHITGGGIPGNVPRILPTGLGAKFTNLHPPHPAIQDLQRLGNVDEEECYRTWHCGTAMLLFSDQAEEICRALNSVDEEVQAQIVGEVTNDGKIEVASGFSGKKLIF
ncbi:hypothetical protein K9M41_04010 [Candidatus Gracilibacteria bacterium]|nr:hypothetical protein [Candidatus Gracilibacteria bacterium]